MKSTIERLLMPTARYIARIIELFSLVSIDFRIHLKMRKDIARPFFLCVVDQFRLLNNSGVTAQEYYMQALWDPALLAREKREYLGAFGSLKWQTTNNDVSYEALMSDKLLFDVVLRNAGIPTVKTLAIYSKTAPSTYYPVIKDAKAFENWLQENGENIFIKPLRGINGKGTLSIGKRLNTSQPTWERLPLEQPLSLDTIINHVRNPSDREFIIQKRLMPSAETAKFSTNVLQTLRVMTLRSNPGISLVAAAIKIASGNSEVDNLLQGKNLLAAVNLDNGRLGAAVEIVNGKPVWHSIHPTSGTLIEGTYLNNIDEIKTLVMRAAENFPWFTSIGWDVALTEEGPLILEGNHWSDVILIQLAHQKGLLGWHQYRAFFNDNRLYRKIGMGFMKPLPV